LVNTSPSDFLTFALFTDSDVEVGTASAPANVLVHGDLQVNGTKSALATLPNGHQVALYAVESPQNWFEDFGSAHLRDGVAVVTLEAVYTMTVNTDLEYHVFLTPNGDCRGLYVARKSPRNFEVRELGGGRSNVRFDYRIVALRRGFETIRLEEFETVSEPLGQESPDEAQGRSRIAEANTSVRRQRTTLRPVKPQPGP
jgi:hypothetical protein